MHRRYLLFLLCFATLISLADDHTSLRGEYWFDDQQDCSVSVGVSADGRMDFMADASQLPEGLHRLNYRAFDSEGYYSPLQAWLFYRCIHENSLENPVLHYWIDNGQQQTRSIEGDAIALEADASMLSEGLHTIKYRVICDGGAGSETMAWQFYKVSLQPKGASLRWYRVWWNNHEDKAIEVQLPNGTAEYLYEETLAVPEYARNDDWSRNCTATFHLMFCDDLGLLSPVENAEVPYPDVYPPRTTLRAIMNADNIILQWTVNKDNVRDYNVYYSENGEPYVLWRPNTVQTEATFRGQHGNSYRFLVTARDDKGQYEAMEESKAVVVEF